MEIHVRDRISPEELDEKIKAIEAAERAAKIANLGHEAARRYVPAPETIADFNASVVLGSD